MVHPWLGASADQRLGACQGPPGRALWPVLPPLVLLLRLRHACALCCTDIPIRRASCWARSAGCVHANVTVSAGKTYLFRIANAAQLAYQTICLEGHDVTLVAADSVPIEPIAASQLNASRPGCVNINSGQR